MSKRERLHVRDHEPTEKQILEYIGAKARKTWTSLHDFLAENYDFRPELSYWGEKYGWTIRYRKSGKTLTAFYPEKGGFTVQVILGKKEVDKFQSMREEFSRDIVELFDETKQLHDGRWLWIKQPENGTIDDIKKLIQLKRKPKEQSSK
ncbi:MAG: DUF3788 domain-containing protein [Candidatus Thorarchaeota archaeon]